ncbi:hypothetical protein GTV32_17665 [Gordonia sp. SID5947]|uniref:pyridoxamine 5'-phosphate oxidase family protein n=1 Tax=Gordonia sp. SID5947 TaxID=2690315 RepID=UPI001369EC81|nr:pyridoxamine 5'-phosphate oxidase family protein [Gordonia sp. SID5947]MYR08015.1 hypothetical protein [Gordonia sp. SID5947]
MDTPEMQNLLHEPHVAVLAIERATKPPLMVPMWYGVEQSGNIFFCTEEETLKTRLIRRTGRVSFLVQRTTMPYSYVGIEGAVTERPASADDVRSVSARYLDPATLDAYVSTVNIGRTIRFDLTPTKVRAVDLSS